jgi:hypothetical protein
MITLFNLETLENKTIAYFKVTGSEDYDIRIKIENKTAKVSCSDCTCKFGSIFGHSKKNQEEKKLCRHLNSCLDLLKYLNQIKEIEYVK